MRCRSALLALLVLLAVTTAAQAQQASGQELAIRDTEAGSMALLPGASTWFKVTFVRYCTSPAGVLPAATVTIETKAEPGLAVQGISSVAVPQRVCSSTEASQESVMVAFTVTAATDALAGTAKVRVTMVAKSSDPVTRDSSPAQAEFQFTILDEADPGVAGTETARAAPGAGPLTLLALLGCVARLRRMA